MKLALSSFVYYNYPLREAIRRLSRFGYEGIEIWGGRPHLYCHDLDGEIGNLRKLLDQCQIEVPNLVPAQVRYPSILCSSNETVRQDSVQYIKDEIDNTLRIGAPSISLCAGMTVYGETVEKGWAKLKQSLVELLDYSDKTDLKILLEPTHQAESTLILTTADALHMIEECASERLGICLDTGHAHVNDENLAEVLLNLPKKIPLHIHVDDNRGDSDSHLIPGEGTIDYQPFVQALKTIGYHGFLTADLGFQYTLEPNTAVVKAHRALSAIFRG